MRSLFFSFFLRHFFLLSVATCHFLSWRRSLETPSPVADSHCFLFSYFYSCQCSLGYIVDLSRVAFMYLFCFCPILSAVHYKFSVFPFLLPTAQDESCTIDAETAVYGSNCIVEVLLTRRQLLLIKSRCVIDCFFLSQQLLNRWFLKNMD